MPTNFPHPQAAAVHAYFCDKLERNGCDPDTPKHTLRRDFDGSSRYALTIRISPLGIDILARDRTDPTLQELLDRQPTDNFDPSAALADIDRALADLPLEIREREHVLFLDPSRFQPLEHAGIRPLTSDDSQALTELHRQCSLQEQRRANINIDHPGVFAHFDNIGTRAEHMTAVASFLDCGHNVFDVGVLVRPRSRGRGLGRAVVSALCTWGLSHNRLVQYCYVDSNPTSARIAESLAFTPYATITICGPTDNPYGFV